MAGLVAMRRVGVMGAPGCRLVALRALSTAGDSLAVTTPGTTSAAHRSHSLSALHRRMDGGKTPPCPVLTPAPVLALFL